MLSGPVINVLQFASHLFAAAGLRATAEATAGPNAIKGQQEMAGRQSTRESDALFVRTTPPH